MRKWFPVIPILIGVAISAYVYPSLPARVVTHWDLHGNPNGYGSRVFATWLLPGLAVVLWAFLAFLPKIDPRKANYARFQDTYDLIVSAVITFLIVIHVLILGHTAGWPLPGPERVIPVAVGVLLLILGNVLPRARSNWWFGIRTPWTLSSETVWTRTHRVGGYLLSAAGAITVLSVFLPPLAGTVVLLVATMGASLGCVVYSYFVWKEEQP